MDTDAKIRLLSQEAQYDLSCACGTKDDDRRKRNADGMWVYPASMPNGGKSIILKTLVSNACSNDCKYCPLRENHDTRRCTLEPDELARFFMDYRRTRNVFGLFLTSGASGNADKAMGRITATAELLRYRYAYRGFMHLKIIPGCSDAAIEKAISLASAVSLNIETPTADSFAALSDRKDFRRDIVRPVQLISHLTGKGMRYSRVKQTTQFIVGASSAKDGELITATERLYKRWRLERVYFSAYQRGLGDPSLPAEHAPATQGHDLLTREHRLYQVDFLLRRYRFAAGEIPLGPDGNLNLTVDPKQAWADVNEGFFPVRLQNAPRNDLLRVPGLGPTYVKRIIDTRRNGTLRSLSDVGMKGRPLAKASSYVVAN